MSLEAQLRELADRDRERAADPGYLRAHYATLGLDIDEAVPVWIAYLCRMPPDALAISLAGRMYEIGYQAGWAAAGESETETDEGP
jgi:hypothetical protein